MPPRITYTPTTAEITFDRISNTTSNNTSNMYDHIFSFPYNEVAMNWESNNKDQEEKEALTKQLGETEEKYFELIHAISDLEMASGYTILQLTQMMKDGYQLIKQ